MQLSMRLSAIALLMAVVVGCSEPTPPPPDPNNPPPKIKTQGEIVSEFQPAYQPLQAAVGSGSDVDREAGKAIASALSSAKGKNAAEQNANAAIAQVTTDIEELLKKANEKELWGTVVSGCDALGAVDPTNPKIARFKDRALLQLNRPKVRITGSTKIPSQSDKTVFFLDVFLPEKNKTESVKQSVGDEFLGLRFVEVIGNDQGIKLEYKATGDIFSVPRQR